MNFNAGNVNIMSALSTTILLTSNLTKFNDQDVATFKQHLWHILNIENERQFICRFLAMLYNPLTLQVLADLQTKATQIYTESQYPQSQARNRFESLPGGVIQNIATFLSKKASVELGYTSRHLYKESQSMSYIIACSQHNHQCYRMIYHNNTNYLDYEYTYEDRIPAELKLDNKQFSQMALSNMVGCSYSYPHLVFIDSEINKGNLEVIENTDSKRAIFNNIFSKLKCLNGQSKGYSIFPLVPVDLLFNKKNNSDSEIKSIQLGYPNQNIVTFATNYSKYVSTEDCSVRSLEELHLSFDPSKEDQHRYVNTLLRSFDGNFKRLTLCEGILHVTDISTVAKIFHSNLESFQFSFDGSIHISKTLDKNIASTPSLADDISCAKLRLFELDTTSYYPIPNDEVTIFDSQFASKILSNIEVYKITWVERYESNVDDTNTSTGYVWDFLQNNLGVNSVCSKVKYIKCFVHDTDIIDQSSIFQESANVLFLLNQFNRENLNNAVDSHGFEYFSLHWDFQSVQQQEELLQDEEDGIHVYNLSSDLLSEEEYPVDPFDTSLDIVDIRIDFSQHIGVIHNCIIEWLTTKIEETSLPIGKIEVRLRPK